MAIKMLVMGLTGRCNLACRYCYAANAPPCDMRFETARRAIELVAASGEAFVLQFSGGEPLLAFALMKQIAAYIRTHKIRAHMQLQTNATLITDEIADFLARSRIAVGVSLDGRPEANDRQRVYPDGSGASRDAVFGISRLARRGMAVGLTAVVTNENAADLSGIVEMAYYLGNVRRIGFDLLRGQGRGSSMRPAPPDVLAASLEKTFARADEMEKKSGRRIVFSQEKQACAILKRDGRSSDFSHCHAMNGEGLYVDPEGKFFVCCSLASDAVCSGEETFSAGDVEIGIDFEKVEKAASFIREKMGVCRVCSDFSACGGGCLARWDSAAQSPEECALKRAAIRRARA